ncbi:MAG: cation transporting ATPase C-terminal domain-containing protein, partial [Verrucomicrobiota bacterium]
LVQRPPRPKREGILTRLLLERLAIVGLWLSAGVLGVFYWMWDGREENLMLARTGALTTLVLFQMVHVFNCRSEHDSIFRKSLFSNKILFIGVVASLAAHVAVIYLPWTQDLLSLAPLEWTHWLLAFGVALTALIVNELHKYFRRPAQGA